MTHSPISLRFGALSPALVAQNDALFTHFKKPFHELVAQLEALSPKPRRSDIIDPIRESNRLATERLLVQRLEDPSLKGPACRAALTCLRKSSLILEPETPLGEAFLNAVTQDLLNPN